MLFGCFTITIVKMCQRGPVPIGHSLFIWKIIENNMFVTFTRRWVAGVLRVYSEYIAMIIGLIKIQNMI